MYNFNITTAEAWSKILHEKFLFETTVVSAVPQHKQDALFKSVSTTIHTHSLAVTELQTEVMSLKAEIANVKSELARFKSDVNTGFAQCNAASQQIMQLLQKLVTEQAPRYDGPRTRKRTSSQFSPMENETRNVRSALDTNDSSDLSPLPTTISSSNSTVLAEISAPSLSLMSLPQVSPSSHPGCVHVFEKLTDLHFKDLLHMWISKKLSRNSNNWVVKNSKGNVCPQNKYKLLTVIELLMGYVLPEDITILQNPETTPETVACLLEIQNKVNKAILDFKEKFAAADPKHSKVRPQFKPGVTAIYGIIENMKSAGEFPFHTQVTRHSPSKSGALWDLASFFSY